MWRIYISGVSPKIQIYIQMYITEFMILESKKEEKTKPARSSSMKSFSNFQLLLRFHWSSQLRSYRNWDIYISNQIHWLPWQCKGEWGELVDGNRKTNKRIYWGAYLYSPRSVQAQHIPSPASSSILTIFYCDSVSTSSTILSVIWTRNIRSIPGSNLSHKLCWSI